MSDEQLIELEDFTDGYGAVVFGEPSLAGPEIALGIADDECWSP